MRKRTGKWLCICLTVVMTVALLPVFSAPPVYAAEPSGTAEMNVLTALGIDSNAAPEGFDANSSKNPYGRDNITLNPVREVLITGVTKETGSETTETATSPGIVAGEGDTAVLTVTTRSAVTTYRVKSTLYGDGYKTVGGSVSDLFANNEKMLDDTLLGTETSLNVEIEESHTSPASITTSALTYTVKEPETLSAVAASATAAGNFDGNEEGKRAQVVMVSTNELATGGGIYLSFGEYGDSKDGTYGYFGTPKAILGTSDPIGNSNLAEDFKNNPYLMQNYLKVTTGDYDGDGTDEVAVFVPDLGNSRIEIYKLRATSTGSGGLEYFGNPSNWDLRWTYPLSETEYVSNMVSLASGDFDQDGLDDLGVTWGYYYGPDRKNGGTAAVLFGSAGSMLQESVSFPLTFGTSDIVRAAFTYGDIMGSGSGQLILGGELNSDIENGNLSTRCITVYSWNGSGFIQTFAQNYNLKEKTSSGGQTVYKYSSLGVDTNYAFLSSPVCVSNLAVISRGLSLPAMLYFDSMQFTYGDGGLSLTGLLDHVSALTAYAEYGAKSGDLLGRGYGTAVTLQCELPYVTGAPLAIFSYDWWMYLFTGVYPTITVPAAAYLNIYDYNPDSTYKTRRPVDPSVSVCLPNTDQDTSYLKYTGVHYFRYSDPKLLAVLASPPYFADLMNRSDLSGNYAGSQTTYSSSKGDSGGLVGHVTLSAGVYVSMEQEFSIFGVKIGQAEAETALTAKFTWDTKYTSGLEQSIEYSTSPGENVVALYSIPMEIYEYEATFLDSDTGQLIKQVMAVNVPHTAAVRVMPVEKYNQIAQNYDLSKVGSNVLRQTLGNPASYPASAAGYNKAVVYNGDWSAVGYSAASGGAGITQAIEMSSQWENVFSGSIGQDFKAGAGLGGVTLGFTAGYEVGAGWATVTTEGSSFSGTLQNMPAEAEEYGYYYAWKVFYYEAEDERYFKGTGHTFPVVSYLVADVSAPPPLPTDFEQNVEDTTQDQIALTWSYDKSVAGFQFYRYYEFPDGSGSYELAFVGMNDGVYDSKTGKWYFEYIDTGLGAYTDYSYQIQTVRSQAPNKSIKSEVLTVRTKSDTGYPQLSLFSSTDESFNTGDTAGILRIFPDSTNSVKALVANAASYPQGISYQWQKLVNGKWTDIANRKTDTITFSGSGDSDAGIYRCRTNVTWYDPARGQTYYISAYTDSFSTVYSKRTAIVSDNGGFTAGLDGDGLPVLSLTLESSNLNHMASPTGTVTFDIIGENYNKSYTVELGVSETRYATARLDASVKNSAGQPIATPLAEGVYEVTAYYSGSRVFQSLEIEAVPLLSGESGYLLTLKKDGATAAEFTYGDTVTASLGLYTKTEGSTSYMPVTEGITYSIQKTTGSGLWTTFREDAGSEFVTPAVGSYRVLVASSVPPFTELASREFIVAKRPLTVGLDGDLSASVEEVEGHLPELALSPDSELAGGESLGQLGLYIRYLNTAGNEVTMGDDIHSVISVINGQKVTKTIQAGTPPGSYTAAGAPADSQTEAQKAAFENYNITFLPSQYTIVGKKYEVKLTALPVNGITAGALEVISPDTPASTYGAGTSLTVLASPYSGYAVKQWTVAVIPNPGNPDGGITMTQAGINTLSYTMLNEPIEILVEFTVPDNTLNVSATPASGGAVTWDTEYFTNGTKVAKDAQITFTATPSTDWHFLKWQKISSGLTTDVYGDVYEFTMGSASTMIYAIFERDAYTLSLGENLTAYYWYDDDGNSQTAMVKKYVTSGAAVSGDIQITAEPKAGYSVQPGATWFVNGADTGLTGSSYTFIMLRNTSVDIATDRGSYDVALSITEPAGADNAVEITVDGAPAEQGELSDLPGGSRLVFQAVPAYGYVFDQWNITAGPSTPGGITTTAISADPELTVAALGSNLEIEAVFANNNGYTVNVSIISGKSHGTLSYSLNAGPAKAVQGGTIPVYEGDDLELIVTPDSSSMVDVWYIDGEVLNTPAKQYAFSDIRGGHTVTVVLKAKAYYTVSYSAVYSVASDTVPGILRATADGIPFLSGNNNMGGGSLMEFTASPDEGYMVDHWTLNGNTVKNPYGKAFTENVLTFYLSNHSDVVVYFGELLTHSVSIYSVHADVDASYSMRAPEGTPWNGAPYHGATGSFTVTPDPGYRVTGIDVSGSDISVLAQPGDKNGVWSLIIGSIDGDTAITVETKRIWSISKTAVNGTIDCVSGAVEGEEVALTATAAPGYEFSDWTVTYTSWDLIEEVSVTDNKFTMPGADVNVTATFSKSGGGGGGGGGGSAPETPFVTPSAVEIFDDVDEDDWFAEATNFVFARGLFKGISETLFGPNETMTRAMFVTVLGRLAGVSVDHSADSGFSDVADDGWSSGYIGWAARNGIVGGYGDGSFQPDKAITREEMAAILFNFAKWTGYEMLEADPSKLSRFADGGGVSLWAVNAMSWAVNAGIITGIDDGMLLPGAEATRAQVSAILMRFVENMEH